jgi:uncharacterized protein YndB with AHSA1/START domain
MKTISIEAGRTIAARPESVYHYLEDYQKRPNILTDHFQDYGLDKGRYGAGTVFHYRFRAGRMEREYHMQVEEAHKGRELRERDLRSSLVTTWTVMPSSQGRESWVTITTTWQGSGGIGGFFERAFAPKELQHIYTAMLDRLAQIVPAASAELAQPVG